MDSPGCDLLSDCIFDILVYSVVSICSISVSVVICFQIVSLTYWFTAKANRVVIDALL